jgi:hypothetical protein
VRFSGSHGYDDDDNDDDDDDDDNDVLDFGSLQIRW